MRRMRRQIWRRKRVGSNGCSGPQPGRHLCRSLLAFGTKSAGAVAGNDISVSESRTKDGAKKEKTQHKRRVSTGKRFWKEGGVKGRSRRDRRVLESALPSSLLALQTLRIIRVALDLLLATRETGDSQSLAWFPRLRHAPVRIDRFAVNDGLAMRTVVVEVARPFGRHILFADKTRQEVGARPDTRTDRCAPVQRFGLCGRPAVGWLDQTLIRRKANWKRSRRRQWYRRLWLRRRPTTDKCVIGILVGQRRRPRPAVWCKRRRRRTCE
jgi:hypothetical protein